jgi:hypothetical protein
VRRWRQECYQDGFDGCLVDNDDDHFGACGDDG